MPGAGAPLHWRASRESFGLGGEGAAALGAQPVALFGGGRDRDAAVDAAVDGRQIAVVEECAAVLPPFPHPVAGRPRVDGAGGSPECFGGCGGGHGDGAVVVHGSTPSRKSEMPPPVWMRA